MSKLNHAAFFGGLLVAMALGNPGYAQDADKSSDATPAVDQGEDRSYLCSEERRILIRDLSRTDGDTNPPLQTEEECKQQYFFVVGEASK
jgi:hypothetical protein